jgi:two-component system, chemotaxis family, sensor kinase CheA
MVQKQEVMLFRNSVIPIVRLSRVLEVPVQESMPKQLTIVIVRKGEKLSGFVVDSVIGQQEIVIKSLGKLMTGIKTIAGATILGDGNVALIVDVNSMV